MNRMSAQDAMFLDVENDAGIEAGAAELAARAEPLPPPRPIRGGRPRSQV